MDRSLQKLNTCAVKVGQQIRTIRKSKNWTQAELGERAELSVNYISRVERGNCTVTLQTLFTLASVLGVSTSLLLEPCDLKDALYTKEFISMLLVDISSLPESDVLFLRRVVDILLLDKDK